MYFTRTSFYALAVLHGSVYVDESRSRMVSELIQKKVAAYENMTHWCDSYSL